ncbi:MAG: carboxypeptidase M32 [Candidatus Woesebacteria bacterium]|jgi:carboxypeptidase Taq
MKAKDKNVKKLLEAYEEISMLGKTKAILSWDLNVNLPDKAADTRAQQTAYLTKLITEKWLDEDFRGSLEKASKNKKKLTVKERAIVRNLNYAGKYYYKIPKEVIIEFSRATSKAFIVWQKARKQDRFKDFLPELKKLIRLNKLMAKHLGYEDNSYDALLDLYEPNLDSTTCKKIFRKLQPKLTNLIKSVEKKNNDKGMENLLGEHISYPEQDQRQVAMYALRKIGYDLEAGRMDISAHPFTTELGKGDVRITNRYKTNDFVESLMVALHEGGHALYEQGIKDEYYDTPLEGGVSLGIHESQSRFWENQVGRSFEFVKFMTPVLQAFYPEQLSKTDTEILYRLFNRVKPGLIRVEADEVTYNLHIILRFEIEDALMNDRLKPEDLPGEWNEKMKKYLGVTPETDRDGVLQDVHWSHGPFGYFPTYTLGNLYAAQITHKMAKEIDLDELIGRGELGTILSWLRGNIHQYASLHWPDDLIKKVTGEKLNPKYFLDYIDSKFSEIYE